MSTVQQLLSLSSGTLASLAGTRETSVIDRLQETLVIVTESIEDSGLHRFDSWQDIWRFAEDCGLAGALVSGGYSLERFAICRRLWFEDGKRIFYFRVAESFRPWRIEDRETGWRLVLETRPEIRFRPAPTAIDALKMLFAWAVETTGQLELQNI